MTFPASRRLDPAVTLGPAARQTADQPLGLELDARGEFRFALPDHLGTSPDLAGDLLALDGAGIDLVGEEPAEDLQGQGAIGGSVADLGFGHAFSSDDAEDDDELDEKQIALAAVSAASDAVLDLVEFTRHDHDLFSGDPVENLADALKLVIRLQLARHDEYDRTGIELLNQLDHALWCFLDDWS